MAVMTENPPQAPPPSSSFMASLVKKIIPSAILPSNTRADAAAAAAAAALQTPAKSLTATKSYDEAAAACTEKVEKIGNECRRFNHKYRGTSRLRLVQYDDVPWSNLSSIAVCLDAHFDLTLDETYCLQGLIRRPDSPSSHPEARARVDQIFEDPVFFKDGATAGDVEQGGVSFFTGCRRYSTFI